MPDDAATGIYTHDAPAIEVGNEVTIFEHDVAMDQRIIGVRHLICGNGEEINRPLMDQTAVGGIETGAQFLPELRGEVERHHSREGDDEAPEKNGRFPDSPLGDSHNRGDEPEKADEEVGVEKEPPDVSVGPYMPQIRVFPSSVS